MKSLAWAGFFAMTALAAPAPALWSREEANTTIEVYFGASRFPVNHVGNLTGSALSDKFSEALSSACKRDCSGSYSSGSKCCTRDFLKFDNIFYDADGSLAHNAYLAVSVRDWNFPAGHPGLREALIDTVAMSARIQTEDAKNCYPVKLSGQDLTFCNMSKRLDVTISDGLAWLYVGINFSKTDNQRFDCPAIKEAVERGMREEPAVGDAYASALGKTKDSLTFSAKCGTDDQASMIHSSSGTKE